jgi:hypothetical protein
MGEQIHISLNHKPLCQENFEPIANGAGEVQTMLASPNLGGMLWKPSGGLWTSSYSPDHLSNYAWTIKRSALRLIEIGVPICEVEPTYGRAHAWEVKPRKGVRITIIDSASDWQNLGDRYGWLPVMIAADWDVEPHARGFKLNFEAVSASYDAVRVTERGLDECKSKDLPISKWGTESTLWLRWAFNSVRDVGLWWPDFPSFPEYIPLSSRR